MATYEYICLACEHPFEQRRPMGGSIDTALACPSCGSDRLRRRFSFFTGGGAASEQAGGGGAPGPASGGCACGGACACGG
jgi:putative FmdB family regulatory protein